MPLANVDNLSDCSPRKTPKVPKLEQTETSVKGRGRGGRGRGRGRGAKQPLDAAPETPQIKRVLSFEGATPGSAFKRPAAASAAKKRPASFDEEQWKEDSQIPPIPKDTPKKPSTPPKAKAKASAKRAFKKPAAATRHTFYNIWCYRYHNGVWGFKDNHTKKEILRVMRLIPGPACRIKQGKPCCTTVISYFMRDEQH